MRTVLIEHYCTTNTLDVQCIITSGACSRSDARAVINRMDSNPYDTYANTVLRNKYHETGPIIPLRDRPVIVVELTQ